MQKRLLVLILLLACQFARLAGAAEPQQYLEQRVQALEQQLRELSERLQQLEQKAAVAKPAYAVTLEQANTPEQAVAPGWKTAAAWEKLRRGMNQIQVTQLLGNPDKRSGDNYAERWNYSGDRAWVEFDQIGEVRIWQAPAAN